MKQFSGEKEWMTNRLLITFLFSHLTTRKGSQEWGGTKDAVIYKYLENQKHAILIKTKNARIYQNRFKDYHDGMYKDCMIEFRTAPKSVHKNRIVNSRGYPQRVPKKQL